MVRSQMRTIVLSSLSELEFMFRKREYPLLMLMPCLNWIDKAQMVLRKYRQGTDLYYLNGYGAIPALKKNMQVFIINLISFSLLNKV